MRSVQKEMALQFSDIAVLNLKWWQKVQGTLNAITAISTLYLLSILGVEGESNSLVQLVGAAGALSLSMSSLFGLVMLVRIQTNHERLQKEGSLVASEKSTKSIRSVSATEIGEGMYAAALI